MCIVHIRAIHNGLSEFPPSSACSYIAILVRAHKKETLDVRLGSAISALHML